jgi:peroxiredoxin Q/BCP
MPTIGEIAPDFELLNDEGQPVRLSDYRGRRVVLYFYPKDFTPGCELQSCQFRDAHADFTARNAVVLGVSADDVESHRAFRAAHGLPFSLLVDAEFEQSKLWGAYGTKEYPDGVFSGIIRAHFVIDEEGRIADVQSPVKATESVQLALAKVTEMAG